LSNITKKKINIVGSSLYSLFLAYHLSKDKNNEITIYEKSTKILPSFNHINIKGIKLNPGFHAFEKKRSKLLIDFLKKDFGNKFSEIKKGRGLIIDKYLIDETSNYENWPQKIIKKYNLKEKKINYRIDQVVKKKENKYCSYLVKNLGKKLDYLFTVRLVYPWFFPRNYSINSKDEGLKNLNLIRQKKFKNTYFFPRNYLFENLLLKIYETLKKKKIKFRFNCSVKFKKDKNKNLQAIVNNKIIEGLNVICLPFFSILSNLQNIRLKLPKLIPHQYFTAVIKTQNTNELDKFAEIIVSSDNFKYLRRISKINSIKSKDKSFYQIEFLKDKKINNLNQQIKNYTNSLSEVLDKRLKLKKKIKFNLEGAKFVRFIFSPKEKIIDDVIRRFKKVCKLNKKLLIPRYITWPINTNKQYFNSISDLQLIKKLQ